MSEKINREEIEDGHGRLGLVDSLVILGDAGDAAELLGNALL
jgi:hypothetical protein